MYQNVIGEGTSKIILCGHRTSWTNSNQVWESFISWHKVFNLYILGGGGSCVHFHFFGGGGGVTKRMRTRFHAGGGGGVGGWVR